MKDAKSCSVKFPRQLALGLARNGNADRATTAPMRQVISRVLRVELTPGGQLGQVGINAVMESIWGRTDENTRYLCRTGAPSPYSGGFVGSWSGKLGLRLPGMLIGLGTWTLFLGHIG